MLRLVALFIAIFFLPSIASAAWQPELRIGLSSTASTFSIQCSLPAVLSDASNDQPIGMLGKDKPIAITIDENKISVNGIMLNTAAIDIRPRDGSQLGEMITAVGDQKLSGGVRLLLSEGHFVLINLTTVEQYLRGVVPSEMPAGWHVEALKAQTIAARTFAMQNRKRHEAAGFDVCTTVHCQVFKGTEGAHENSDKAIVDTAGEVMVFKGALINAMFHTDSGGMTESTANVWGGDLPYLQSVEDYEMKTQPWEVKMTSDEFASKLNAASKGVGSVKSIKLSALEIGKGAGDRTPSGRVREITIVGSDREIKLSGEDMRSILGLPSTLFEVAINGGAIEISGYGRGHGVGMSQYGAKGFAERGKSYKEILNHYYKGIELKKIY